MTQLRQLGFNAQSAKNTVGWTRFLLSQQAWQSLPALKN